MIVVSGFKAYPTEIEDVAMLHPGVKDAGAVGIPDKHSGDNSRQKRRFPVAEYPAHLVREHRLYDGRIVTVRPIWADVTPMPGT